MRMKTLFLLAAISSFGFSSFESTTYFLDWEGDSAGRFSGAESSSYSLEGGLCEVSGYLASAAYELVNGWYYTINSDCVPPPPAGFFATTLENGNINLIWQGIIDGASPVRGYRVYRAVRQSDFGILLAEIDGAEYTDTAGLIYGITYYYKVIPVDMGNNATVEGNVVVSALSKSLSTSINSLSALSRENGRIELAWTPVNGISYYRIYRSAVFGLKGVQVNADGSTTSGCFSQVAADGLSDAARYYYMVQGVDGVANEQVQGNNQASAVCDATAPTVPVVFSRTHPDSAPSTENCPEFSWVESEDPKAPSDGASGVSGYCYYISSNASENPGPGWHFTENISLKSGKIEDGDWYFHVAAIDKAGNRSQAASKQFVIRTCGTVSGYLYAGDGKTPLKDTRVELVLGVTVLPSTRTDLAGFYSFAGVPFGAYKLKVYRAGHDPYFAGEVSVSKGTPSIGYNCIVHAIQNVAVGSSATYPNPCRIGTLIFVYSLEAPSKVVIDVYDSAGEKVTSIEETQPVAGFRETKWDASSVPTGVYFYRVKLETGGSSTALPVKKFSLIR